MTAEELRRQLRAAGADPAWMRRLSVPAMIEQLAEASEGITHELVDALPGDPRRREHLRTLLIAAGLLPPKDYRLALFDCWAHERLHELIAAEERRVVASYLRWHLRPRLVDFADAGLLRAGQIGHARECVNAAISCLRELGGAGSHLGALTQADVDALFAERTDGPLRNFLVWAIRTERCPALTFPSGRSCQRASLSEDRRLELVRSFVTDADVALEVRVAALLVLLLAQPITRVVTLQVDDVGDQAGEVVLALAHTPAPLPGPLAPLVLALAAQAGARARSGATPWLFPGHTDGRPAAAQTLQKRLHRLGVPVSAGRRAALVALAEVSGLSRVGSPFAQVEGAC